MKKYTISAELAMAQIAIENALANPSILKKLSAYQYDRKRLLGGKSLKEEVQMLQSIKQDKYGQQFENTDSLNAQFGEIKRCYLRHHKRARMAFEGQRGILETLQLLGNRKTDINGLLDQIFTFYSKIEGYSEEMTGYSVSPEELAQTKAMVEALYTARQQQVLSIGEAQNATQKRNAKRKELKAWMAQFRKVARLALEDEPQMLEALGIVVKSQKV